MSEILDSGNRREFESGAVRDIQEGKGRCDLLPIEILEKIFEFDTSSIKHSDRYELFLNNIYKYKDCGNTKFLIEAYIVFVRKYLSIENVEKSDIAESLLEVSIHFEQGAKKYGENNWQKGIPCKCYIDSAIRHYLKFIAKYEDEFHFRAVLWNLLCCLWTEECKPEYGILKVVKNEN